MIERVREKELVQFYVHSFQCHGDTWILVALALTGTSTQSIARLGRVRHLLT